jgi:hypothetical protein
MFIATQKQSQSTKIMPAFDIDRHKLLAYLTRVFSVTGLNMDGSENMKSILSDLEWQHLGTDQQLYTIFEQKLISYIGETLYPGTNSSTFLEIVEKMFTSRFVQPTGNILSIVMLRMAETARLNDTLEFFKRSLYEHKMSALEPLILMEAMRPKAMAKIKLYAFMEFMENSYDTALLDNFVFIAHVLNGDLDRAGEVFKNKLGSEVDLQVLERFAAQIEYLQKMNGADQARSKARKYAGRLKNMYKLDFVRANRTLKDEIEAILSKSSVDKTKRGQV